MFLPVERSITVSAPQSVAQRSFSTSSSIDERTAELPMLALIFTWKRRPMIIGSSSGWLMLAGMIARPRATSLRTSSGGIPSRMRHELHLGSDLAAAGVVELGDGAACRGGRCGVADAEDPSTGSVVHRIRRLPALRSGRPPTALARYPLSPHRGQSVSHIEPLRPAAVIHPERRLAAGERDLAHGDADPRGPSR